MKKSDFFQAEVQTDDKHWTEKYAPASGAEVLGNSKVVNKVKNWLVEWKRRTDKEAKRLEREMRKQAKKQGKPLVTNEKGISLNFFDTFAGEHLRFEK